MNEAIVFHPENTRAEVYYSFINQKKQTTVYLVKVSIMDIGVYINSITVQPSTKFPDKLWVQSPRFNIRGTFVWPLQMQKDSPLRHLIEELALNAVAEYSGNPTGSTGYVVHNEEFVEKESKFL